MLTLSELALIINENRLEQPNLLALVENKDSKSATLYNGMLDKTFKQDEEAAFALYGVDKNHTTYRKFKKQFKKKLLNHLFFLNFENASFTVREKAYYSCHKDWAALKILLGKGGWQSAVDICFKILKKAKRFEFTDLAFEVTKILKLYYATREGDLIKYEHFSTQYDRYKKNRDAENLAEELYTDLVVRYVKSKSKEEEAYKNALAYHTRLKDVLNNVSTYWLHLCGFMIELTIHSSKSDYHEIIVVCDRAISFFKKKKYPTNVAMQIFYYQKIVCQTQLKQYELGKDTAKRGLKLVSEGSSNWFLYQEWFYILSMHTQNYAQAFRVFENVVTHKHFQYQPARNKEFWKIYEAYLYLLYYLGTLKTEKSKARLSKFKYRKFYNDTPIYAKDKRGMNIPILIAQTLLLIVHENFGDALMKIEAIQKYSTRHLRQNDVFRSNCFIKMLGKVPSSGFHKVALSRKTQSLAKSLKKVPLEVTSQSHEVEIIPYEDLWEITVDLMKNKRYTPRIKKDKKL